MPKSTYYWMLEHPETQRVDPHVQDVYRVWRDSSRRYGSRKIKASLEREGIVLSRRRICRIMRRNAMTSAYARPAYKPHVSTVNEADAPNVINREFNGYAPHTHIASDLTYVRVGRDWQYICLLIDLADRSIAGHSLGPTRDADLVTAAFATLRFPLTDITVFPHGPW